MEMWAGEGVGSKAWPWLCSKGTCVGQLTGLRHSQVRHPGLYAQGVDRKPNPSIAEGKGSNNE